MKKVSLVMVLVHTVYLGGMNQFALVPRRGVPVMVYGALRVLPVRPFSSSPVALVDALGEKEKQRELLQKKRNSLERATPALRDSGPLIVGFATGTAIVNFLYSTSVSFPVFIMMCSGSVVGDYA